MNLDQNIQKYFGDIFLSQNKRIESYDYIETFISDNVTNWDTAPDTDSLTEKFSKEISTFSKEELTFLICHSGYIPEFYTHDSSQETLYSKLVEALVCEWSVRIGFTSSSLQKQKSSKEDVTIKVKDKVIVCDAKSFRLGRSQSAPNVKDTIKKADYEKWLSFYDEDERVGGFLTFPSLHLWSRSSDVFSYVSDGTTPIVLMVYEQMSYFLVKDIGFQKLIDLMDNYNTVHTETTKSPSEYFLKTITYLFNSHKSDFDLFNSFCDLIIKEKVNHTMEKVNDHLKQVHLNIIDHIDTIPVEELKKNLIESEYHRVCGQLEKQIVNIKKFRPH